MPSGASNNQRSDVYAGLAGETAQGRVTECGVYRMSDGSETWELLSNGLPEAPAVRALAIHPRKPEIIYAGTQHGPYRSSDHGDHWEKVDVPDRGMPVWSILFHPHNSDLMYAGYENCEIYRSEDCGETWQRLPVSVRFPEITTAPGANPAKRVLMLDASTTDPDVLYGAIEVGGIIRSTDGGEHWENLGHGQYLNDDTVDMHGVLVSRWRPEQYTASAGRECSAAPIRVTTGAMSRLSRLTRTDRSTAVTSAKSRAIRGNFGSRRAPISKAISACCSTARTAARVGTESILA